MRRTLLLTVIMLCCMSYVNAQSSNNSWTQFEGQGLTLLSWGWDENNLNGQMPEKMQKWLLFNELGGHFLIQTNVHDGRVMFDYKIEGDVIRLTNRYCMKTDTVDENYNGWVRIIRISRNSSKETIVLTVDSYGVYRLFKG